MSHKNCSHPLDIGHKCASNVLMNRHHSVNKKSVQFYFDKYTGLCRSFVYQGCGGGRNRFSSIEHCKLFCINKDNNIAKLSPMSGKSFKLILINICS